MMNTIKWQKLDPLERKRCLQRPAMKMQDLTLSVSSIIERVKNQGDNALLMYTEKFDHICLSEICVNNKLINTAESLVTAKECQYLYEAASRIENYQRACVPREVTVDTNDGIVCRRRPVAIDSVGLYVPGGSAPLISTLLMLAIPAKVAGCATKVLCTPPNKNGDIDPLLLLAAKYCGIEQIFKVGGAQAIAAMAYGTESVPQVNKIFGPGNAWVTAAKTFVANDINGASIDMPAGPSELMVIADQCANASFVAADLLSQAEHGPDSQVILITDSVSFSQQIVAEIKKQNNTMLRKDIIVQSLLNSTVIIVDEIKEAVNICNSYAPEHLSLQVENPQQYLSSIRNAGAIFIGPWTPETMGDYVNGANHVLPTYRCANRMSGLSVADFMKYISIQEVTSLGLDNLAPMAMFMAEAEGLDAHKNAVERRVKYLKELSNVDC